MSPCIFDGDLERDIHQQRNRDSCTVVNFNLAFEAIFVLCSASHISDCTSIKDNISRLTDCQTCMHPDNLPPSFPHPTKPGATVHVVLDACHMLKLARNTFAEGIVCTDGGQQDIHGCCFNILHKTQEEEGLRLANNLKTGHTEWRKQKVKVHLATQVFSSSMADDIIYCYKKLQKLKFRNSEGMIQISEAV